MKFEKQYFSRFNFSKEQIKKYFENAEKDLKIAHKVDIAEVKFNYAYTAFIKSGIALLASLGVKTRSVPGHHVKIIEKISDILKDESIADMGNLMRSKRNLDLYSGGVEVTNKECGEYIKFVGKVLARILKRI